jgi:hypothetical protein
MDNIYTYSIYTIPDGFTVDSTPGTKLAGFLALIRHRIPWFGAMAPGEIGLSRLPGYRNWHVFIALAG